MQRRRGVTPPPGEQTDSPAPLPAPLPAPPPPHSTAAHTGGVWGPVVTWGRRRSPPCWPRRPTRLRADGWDCSPARLGGRPSLPPPAVGAQGGTRWWPRSVPSLSAHPPTPPPPPPPPLHSRALRAPPPPPLYLGLLVTIFSFWRPTAAGATRTAGGGGSVAGWAARDVSRHPWREARPRWAGGWCGGVVGGCGPVAAEAVTARCRREAAVGRGWIIWEGGGGEDTGAVGWGGVCGAGADGDAAGAAGERGGGWGEAEQSGRGVPTRRG